MMRNFLGVSPTDEDEEAHDGDSHDGDVNRDNSIS